MSTELNMTLEALTDLLQLSSVGFQIESIENTDEFLNTVKLNLSGSEEYDGKRIILSYLNPNGDKEVEDECVNKNFMLNRLHTITEV